MHRWVKTTPCRSSTATTLDLADLRVTWFEAGTSWIGISGELDGSQHSVGRLIRIFAP
jgi:hypothetical protein